MADVTQKSRWSLKNRGSTKHTWSVLFTCVSYFPRFTRHYISKVRYATSDLSSTSLMQLRTLQLQLLPRIAKLSTSNFVNTKNTYLWSRSQRIFLCYDDCSSTIYNKRTTRSFHTTLTSSRQTLPHDTEISTVELRPHAFTPRQVVRPGRKLGGFGRLLLTRLIHPCFSS